MTEDLETQVAEGQTPDGKCSICDKTPLPDDTFLAGFQDPQNKRVALVRLCRVCFVVNTFPLLRSALDEQWYVRTQKS